MEFQTTFSVALVDADVVEDGGFGWFPSLFVCHHSIVLDGVGNVVPERRDGRGRKHGPFLVLHLEPPTDRLGTSGDISKELIHHISNPESRGNMLAIEAGRVGLAVRELEFARFGTQVIREDILFFDACFSYVAMPSSIVGDVVVDGNSIGVVDNDATLVGLDDDVVRDDRRRVVRHVKVYGVATWIKKGNGKWKEDEW